MAPILTVTDVPPPPGWDDLPPAVRVDYLLRLAAVRVFVGWPTGRAP
jgi:hypothetical protein